MNRKSDLLDVFRSSPSKSPQPQGAAPSPARARTPKGPGQAIVLERRQALIVLSGVTLLVVLAFVGGIGIGRGSRKTARDATPGLSRAATAWRIRGAELPWVGGPSGEDVRSRVAQAFPVRYPQLHWQIEDVAVSPGKAVKFRLCVFGFASRQDAVEAQLALQTWEVGGYYPFDHASIQEER